MSSALPLTRSIWVGLGFALIEEFVGGSGVEPVAGKDSWKGGNEAESGGGAPAFRGVTYSELWDGITLHYEQVKGGVAESVYVIRPGADAGKIRVRYNMDFSIREDGGLNFFHPTGRGSFTVRRPVAWQQIGEKRVPVEVGFKVYADRTVGFGLGVYNPGYPVIIDPTYQWHAFYGSASDDLGFGIAVTDEGVYVTGSSASTWNVGSTGPLHPYSGFSNIVIMKFDHSGAYQWHSFYGSSNGADWGMSIAVRGDDVYVTGYSGSTWDVNATGPLYAHSGGEDIVTLKLDTEGAYKWHSFFGSGVEDRGFGIAVAGTEVYVTGYSYAEWNVNATGPLNAHSGDGDIVILKLCGADSAVRILNAPDECLTSIQDAYDAAIDKDVIQAQAGYFPEGLFIDRSITVYLEGGFDADYFGSAMGSGVQTMSITKGTVVLKNIYVGGAAGN